MKVLVFEDLKPEKGIPYSRVQIWRLCKAGRFPKPIKIGQNRNGWVEEEIDRHIDKLIATRDSNVEAA